MKPLCYVFGKYSDSDPARIRENVNAAGAIGRALILKGYRVYVPHTMTHGWGDAIDNDDDILAMHMEMIPHCHLAFGLSEWEESRGAVREYAEFERNGIPCFFNMCDVPWADEFEFDTVSQIIDDFLHRRRLGKQKYGRVVTYKLPNDFEREAYEEDLDAMIYRKANQERNARGYPLE